MQVQLIINSTCKVSVYELLLFIQNNSSYNYNTMYLVAKLVPVGYGIMKLQISCIVEDEKVGTDFLEEEICKFDDLVSNPCFITCIF